MDKLYSWTAKRAGCSITVAHSCGKISGIAEIKPVGPRLVAEHNDGRRFELFVK